MGNWLKYAIYVCCMGAMAFSHPAMSATYFNTFYQTTVNDPGQVIPMCLAGDGVTNDAACINSTLASTAPGKTVMLPSSRPGQPNTVATYNIGSTPIQVGNGSGVQTLSGTSTFTSSGTVTLHYSGSTVLVPGAKLLFVVTAGTGSWASFNGVSGTVASSPAPTAGSATINVTSLGTSLTAGNITAGSFLTWSTINGVNLACEGVPLSTNYGQIYYSNSCNITGTADPMIKIAGVLQGFKVSNINVIGTGTNQHCFAAYGAWNGRVEYNSFSGCKISEGYYGISNGSSVHNNQFTAWALPDTAHIVSSQNIRQMDSENGAMGLDIGGVQVADNAYMVVSEYGTTIMNNGCPNNQYAYHFGSGDSNLIWKDHVDGGNSCAGWSSSNTTGCAVIAFDYSKSPTYGPNSIKIENTDTNGTYSCLTEYSNIGTDNLATNPTLFPQGGTNFNYINDPSGSNGATIPPNPYSPSGVWNLTTNSPRPIAVNLKNITTATSSAVTLFDSKTAILYPQFILAYKAACTYPSGTTTGTFTFQVTWNDSTGNKQYLTGNGTSSTSASSISVTCKAVYSGGISDVVGMIPIDLDYGINSTAMAIQYSYTAPSSGATAALKLDLVQTQ